MASRQSTSAARKRGATAELVADKELLPTEAARFDPYTTISYEEFIRRSQEHFSARDLLAEQRNVTVRERAPVEATTAFVDNMDVLPADPRIQEFAAHYKISERRLRDFIANERKQQVALPEQAKRLYEDRKDKSQNIVGFLKEHWGVYIAAGVLTRPALRHLDRKAYDALCSWQQHHEVPPELKLPTKSMLIDKAAEQIANGAGIAQEGVQRIGQTLARRRQREVAR